MKNSGCPGCRTSNVVPVRAQVEPNAGGPENVGSDKRSRSL